MQTNIEKIFAKKNKKLVNENFFLLTPSMQPFLNLTNTVTLTVTKIPMLSRSYIGQPVYEK